MRKRNYRIIDEKAFDILVKYRTVSTKSIPKEDYIYALEKGYMFDDKDVTHNEAIDWLYTEYKKINKTSVTASFLASLSTNQVSWRTGLGVYAIMQSFPYHIYQTLDKHDKNNLPCIICSSYPVYGSFNYMNLIRIATGKLLSHSIYNYAFCLQEQNKLSKEIKPNKKDFELFLQFMSFTNFNKEIKGPNDFLKQIKREKIFPLCDDGQLQGLIEIMGYCCILESKKYQGPLNQYINLAVAPRKTHNSDWNYPIDFWKGEDGINIETYNFWFGDYPELSIDNFM